MKTILVTGGIASGKSAVCARLEYLGFPVYDCDSRTKSLYESVPGLKGRVEDVTGVPFSEIGVIFHDEARRRALGDVVYPVLLDDIRSWLGSQHDSPLAFVESAIALDIPMFDSLWDSVLLVKAPMDLRLERNPKTAQRAALQSFDESRADHIIENDSTLSELHTRVDKYIRTQMKTDLAKILAVSGTHGLYEFVAQARNGAIAESLADKKRTAFSGQSRITTLADIAIYTSEGEMRLAEVFLALKNVLGESEAPSSKAPAAELESLFTKAIPNYDADRFYVSHMRKVVDWYNEIARYASFDFVTDEEREAEAAAEQE